MAARLKSISKQIHWFLVLRAIIFGFSYLLLPRFIFLILGIYLYLSPLFQARKFAVPFLTLIVLALIWPSNFNIWLAFLLALIFFLILGIKDLIFIERLPAYEILNYLLIFLLSFTFFNHFSQWPDLEAVLWALGVGFFIFFLVKGLLNYEDETTKDKRQKILITGLGSFLIWELILILLILPLNFLYQTAILFLVSVILIDFLICYFRKELSGRKILTNFSVFFILIVIILASAKWGL